MLTEVAGFQTRLAPYRSDAILGSVKSLPTAKATDCRPSQPHAAMSMLRKSQRKRPIISHFMTQQDQD
jgi:hypothetical protein